MNWFGEVLERGGERPLAEDDHGRRLSYRDALASTRDWAGRLGPGKRLALLLCENSVACLDAYLGLLANGHAAMLVGADTAPAIVEDLTRRYQPEIVVTCRDGAAQLDLKGAARGDLNPELSVLLSTSGSTGSPKAVRFTNSRLAANAISIAQYLGLDDAETALAHLPLQYSFGMSVVNSHLAVGAQLLLTTRSMMEAQFWAMAERATSFSGVPFHYEMLERLRFERRQMPALRTLTQAGGRMPPERVRRFAELAAKRGWRLFVMYGQTEAGPRIAYLPPEDAAEHAGVIGKAIPGLTIELRREDGSLVAGAGEEGELVAVGPSIMLGYAESRADLARGDDMGGRLATGDLAVREANGYVRITGRKSHFIKLQGNRVSLADIERRLGERGFPVVCVGVDDKLWIVLEGAPERVEAARAAAVEAFSFPARSMAVVSVDAVPRSSAQKVLYQDLLAKLAVQSP